MSRWCRLRYWIRGTIIIFPNSILSQFFQLTEISCLPCPSFLFTGHKVKLCLTLSLSLWFRKRKTSWNWKIHSDHKFCLLRCVLFLIEKPCIYLNYLTPGLGLLLYLEILVFITVKAGLESCVSFRLLSKCAQSCPELFVPSDSDSVHLRPLLFSHSVIPLICSLASCCLCVETVNSIVKIRTVELLL